MILHQEDIRIVSTGGPDIRVPKRIRQILTDLGGKYTTVQQ